MVTLGFVVELTDGRGCSTVKWPLAMLVKSNITVAMNDMRYMVPAKVGCSLLVY